MNMKRTPTEKGKKTVRSAKECAGIAVFVALLIASQTVFSALPGVEVVTVLFITYSFTFGGSRGMAAATVFSLLRQVLFGFFPVVLILYLIYYNLLCALFGWLSKRLKMEWKTLVITVFLACICTALFTMLDNVLTPLWYGYSARATRAYFLGSLSFLAAHVICVAITVSALFLPLRKTFALLKRSFLA